MEYKNTYEYKDEIIEKYKDYNPIIHTIIEKDYNWFDNENYICVELNNNNGDNLFIYLEAEITISFSNWHCHYYYEDRSDYEDATEKIDNIINNKDCILIIYSNDKWYGSGSSLNKSKYTKEDALEYIKSFFVGTTYKEFSRKFQKNGLKIVFNYWDKNKNYELILDKEMFSKGE